MSIVLIMEAGRCETSPARFQQCVLDGHTLQGLHRVSDTLATDILDWLSHHSLRAHPCDICCVVPFPSPRPSTVFAHGIHIVSCSLEISTGRGLRVGRACRNLLEY